MNATGTDLRELKRQVAALARGQQFQRMLLADAFPLRRSTEASSSQASAKRKREKEDKQKFKTNVEEYYEVALLQLVSPPQELPRSADLYVLQAVLRGSFTLPTFHEWSNHGTPGRTCRQVVLNICRSAQVDQSSGVLPCFLLGCNLARILICHAHIYPKAKRTVMEKYLGLNDVQAGHNGLLLAKPLQVIPQGYRPCLSVFVG